MAVCLNTKVRKHDDERNMKCMHAILISFFNCGLSMPNKTADRFGLRAV